MSRLDFAPKIDDIKVTDIKRGLGLFAPRPDKLASFAALKAALRKAGYNLASAEIAVAGRLVRDDKGWWVEADHSKQRFALEGEALDKLLQGIEAGAAVEVTGDWQTSGGDGSSVEIIRLKSATRIAAINEVDKNERASDRDGIELKHVQVSIGGLVVDAAVPLAPIRTTSPGLTVYKGGAVMPRYSYTRQHLGELVLDRHALRMGVSYTPTERLQLEAEIPLQRTSYESGAGAGSGGGAGNVTLWGKYRFFRTVETWGDKQAAFRVGVELPTGSKDAPGAEEIAAPEFVRRQVSPIDAGLSLRSDIAYSQARHRFIFGANVETIRRGERDGFRMGHEVRLNTDFEYVLFPLKYRSPGRELFVIVETTYMYRGRGRVGGVEVPGSSASEFYLAPGFQFTFSPRVVFEASYQFPVVHNTGPLVLRTDRNLLVGLRYLY